MLLRAAARGASRAAGSAAAARTGDAASSNGRLFGEAHGYTTRRRLMSDDCFDSGDSAADDPDAAVQGDDEKFGAKDLESDEALWALYERWCKHFNQERDHYEMARQFNEFKETVLCIHEVNNSDLAYRLGITKFTDGKLGEALYPIHQRAIIQEDLAQLPKHSSPNSVFVWRDGRFVDEELKKIPGESP